MTSVSRSSRFPTEVAIITTWHAKDSLEDAIDFFATCAAPTDGFALDSDFRLVICVANQQWAAQADEFLQSAEFFIRGELDNAKSW
jgi:hypothetical protein